MEMRPALVRTFVALPISTALSAALEAWLARTPLRRRGVAWNRPEQWHFTLAFLGEISEDGVSRAVAASRAVASETREFSLCLGDPGAFPPRGAARVLWLGVAQGAEALTFLQRRLAERLREAGLALETREFVPHLTLGRVPPGTIFNREAWLTQDVPDGKTLEVPAREILVMRSDLQRGGARHTLLAVCPLGHPAT
jgi:RNA 2',3'-cyclic 3'-phosphodiesterase